MVISTCDPDLFMEKTPRIDENGLQQKMIYGYENIYNFKTETNVGYKSLSPL